VPKSTADPVGMPIVLAEGKVGHLQARADHRQISPRRFAAAIIGCVPAPCPQGGSTLTAHPCWMVLLRVAVLLPCSQWRCRVREARLARAPSVWGLPR
jgi:hypothetical protein